jgi:radical SAM family RiPP maturation amino acid epimerase
MSCAPGQTLSDRGAPPPSAPARLFQQILAARSAEELHTLALIKRFLELWGSDPELRADYDAAARSGGSFAPLQARVGLPIDLAELIPILVDEFEAVRQSPELENYPLAFAWDRYRRQFLDYRDVFRHCGFTGGHNPAFDTWRQRQIHRLAGELGGIANDHTHPVIAFELSEGCSVGCWFCGISAGRFRGNWPYAQNRAAWHAILDETVDFFGPAAATGFCYWGTDPSDHPDYPDFIADFYDRTGALPQTTTAIPLKNVAQTRRVLALSGQYPTVFNRFSILNRKYLQRVHETFTADELLCVELVTQFPGSLIPKSLAGRAIDKSGGRPDPVVADSTIACVSGFLVSMPLGRVQLVTPTPCTPALPNGFYVLGERRFANPAEFGAALRSLAAEHVTSAMKADDRLMFRPDMTIELLPDGVQMADRARAHSLRGPVARVIGETIASGTACVSDLFGRVAAAGGDPLDLSLSLERLFAKGVLQEQGILPRHAPAPQRAAA